MQSRKQAYVMWHQEEAGMQEKAGEGGTFPSLPLMQLGGKRGVSFVLVPLRRLRRSYVFYVPYRNNV
jgi:hypothetical protein